MENVILNAQKINCLYIVQTVKHLELSSPKEILCCDPLWLLPSYICLLIVELEQHLKVSYVVWYSFKCYNEGTYLNVKLKYIFSPI